MCEQQLVLFLSWFFSVISTLRSWRYVGLTWSVISHLVNIYIWIVKYFFDHQLQTVFHLNTRRFWIESPPMLWVICIFIKNFLWTVWRVTNQLDTWSLPRTWTNMLVFGLVLVCLIEPWIYILSRMKLKNYLLPFVFS